MLGEVFERFVEKSPVSVMVRGLLERVLNPEKLIAFLDEKIRSLGTAAAPRWP